MTGFFSYWDRFLSRKETVPIEKETILLQKERNVKMKLLLEGKSVAENIKSDFEKRIENLEKKPNIAVLGIKGD